MDRGLTRRDALVVIGALASTISVAGCGSAASAPAASARQPPDPTGFAITRWRRDPFARGSYSYLARGAEPGDRATLAESIGGRLFFAGEATHRVFPATVHGALLSGRRAAAEVIGAGATSVVVVGAGAAGLGAAERLHAAGLTVRVVEGRDRVGGRVWTDDSLGVALDLGASWIHGVAGNPLTEIADDAGAVRVATDYDNVVVRDASGAVLADDQVPAELEVVTEIEHEYAADAGDLSPEAIEEGGGGAGGDVVFPGGYAQILPELQTGYDIALGVTVSAIEHGGRGVAVTTDSGSLDADAAVVTVPLGVLKAGAIRFTPPLPATKLGAIDRLGMGLLDKVYLRFDEVFWDADADFVGYAGPERGRFASWVNIAKYTGAPILMAFNAASVAEEIELLTDDAVVAEAMAALRAMYQG